MKGEFIDHAQVMHLHETTAQIVGVDRGEDLYKKVSMQISTPCDDKIYKQFCLV
jgi:hypothetical protein